MSGRSQDVTVVIPVWDEYVRFIDDAVESVRASGVHAAVVVVDNASATPIPELDGCTVIRSEERLSEGAARNLGLEQVATEFVVFLDADDMLLDGALEFMRERIASDPGLAIFATSVLDAVTGQRHQVSRPIAGRLARRPRLFAFADSVWQLLPIQGNAILRTAQVRDAGGYADTDLGEDWDLAVALVWRGRVEVSQRLGRYYRSTEGAPGPAQRTAAELRTIARRIRERIRRDPGVPVSGRLLLPVIALAQILMIHGVRPGYRAVRALAGILRSNIR